VIVQKKKELFSSKHTQIFSDIRNAEKVYISISNIIQFLLSNNIIKKVSMFRRMINKIKILLNTFKDRIADQMPSKIY
jgi:hypothetical protein